MADVNHQPEAPQESLPVAAPPRVAAGLSIRMRLLIAFNIVALVVAVTVGAVSSREARRTIEQRLVHESVRNMAGLASELRLPPTRRFMTQLARISGAEISAVSQATGDLLATTLDAAEALEFSRRYSQFRPGSASLALAGKAYRLDSAPVVIADTRGAIPAYRLVLLLPAAQLRAAQRRAVFRIVLASLAAVIGTNLLGFWLATAISRPVRRLASYVDRMVPADRELGNRLSAGAPDRPPAPHPSGDHAAIPFAMERNGRVPAEIGRLWRSFIDLETRLAEARQQLARSARLAAVGQMAATIAHEIRNPLSGMKMNARVLADELAANRLDDSSVAWIVREIDRLDQYVGELLNLRQVVGDGAQHPPRLVGNRRAVALSQQVDSVLNLLRERARHAGVQIEAQLPGDTPRVYADPDSVRQVLTNLLLNALDAVGGRPDGHIVVTVQGTVAGRGPVRCTVADNGIGIGVDAERLFEPFFTTKPRGSGLGLYVCRQIVEAHGGRIACETRSPGSAFWFELPRSENHDREKDTAADR